MMPSLSNRNPLVGVLCLLTFCGAPGWSVPSHDPIEKHQERVGEESVSNVSVSIGKSIIMDFAQPIQRIAVGLRETAEATATSLTEVLITGKSTGQTTVIVWLRGSERQVLNVIVRPDGSELEARLSAVRRELKTEFPGQSISVTSDNGSIFLRGTVKDLNCSDRAVAIASTALGGAAATLNPIQTGGGKPTGDRGVEVSAGRIVNLLYVDVPAPEKQILLKVQFASVDRSKAKQLGINLFSLGLGNTIGGITTGQFYPPAISGGSGGTGSSNVGSSTAQATFSNELNILAFFPGLNGGADIQALETQGVVEVLAQPNLIAANGMQASFLAGGEYPYPVAQGGSNGSGPTITIMFKEFGVRLNFIPTITPRGSIRLQVAPEVSSLDFTNAVQVSGFQIPAINSRKVKTEVELQEGQSFVIGGLLDNRETQTFQKIPLIGDVPILGRFFQSITRSRTNTELIVLVTPEFIDPMPSGTPLPELKYPAMFLSPNSTIPMNSPEIKPSLPGSPLPGIPIEKLIESLKPEKPLVIDQGFGPAAGGGTGKP